MSTSVRLLGFRCIIFELGAVPQEEWNSQGGESHDGKHKPVHLKHMTFHVKMQFLKCLLMGENRIKSMFYLDLMEQ